MGDCRLHWLADVKSKHSEQVEHISWEKPVVDKKEWLRNMSLIDEVGVASLLIILICLSIAILPVITPPLIILAMATTTEDIESTLGIETNLGIMDTLIIYIFLYIGATLIIAITIISTTNLIITTTFIITTTLVIQAEDDTARAKTAESALGIKTTLNVEAALDDATMINVNQMQCEPNMDGLLGILDDGLHLRRMNAEAATGEIEGIEDGGTWIEVVLEERKP